MGFHQISAVDETDGRSEQKKKNEQKSDTREHCMISILENIDELTFHVQELEAYRFQRLGAHGNALRCAGFKGKGCRQCFVPGPAGCSKKVYGEFPA